MLAQSVRTLRRARVLWAPLALAASLGLAGAVGAQGPVAPLTFVRALPVPGGGGGEFDHLLVDAKSHRLFAANEGGHTVEVFDTRSGRHLQTIGQGLLQTPHSLLYRDDLQRLYVVDGDPKMGALRIYDGRTYKLLKSLDLPVLADWSGYDPKTQYLFISSMGYFAHTPDSKVSVVDTATGEIVKQFDLPDSVITAFSLEPTSPNMYTGLRNKNEIAVTDRTTFKVVATWPFKLGVGSGSQALDPEGHRLFVNCRSGQTLVFDTETGRELQALPINTYSDDLAWDPATKRLYITAKGDPKRSRPTVEVYQQRDPDHYQRLGEVATSPGARTGALAATLHRFFVGAPKQADRSQAVLEYAVD